MGMATQLQLNRNLLLPAIVMLSVYNFLPFGLIAVGNMDILKGVVLIIFLVTCFRFQGYFRKEISPVSFLLIAIVLSTVHMVLKGKYMDWTIFYCLYYINFFLLLISFKSKQDIDDYIRILIFFGLCSTLVHLCFFLFPQLLDGKLNEIRMGSLNNDTNITRVFIPGMGYIAMLFVYLFVRMLYYQKLSITHAVILFAFFCSTFIFASVRNYALGILVAFAVLIYTRKLSLKKLSILAGIGVSIMLILSLLSTDIYQYVVDRLGIFFRVSELSVSDAINLDVDYDNEETFGTVYFRILEVIFVLQNYFNDFQSILFGNIGTLYDFLGVEQAPAPHVGIAGVYFLFGAIGIGTFLYFLLYYTRFIFQNVKRLKNTRFEFYSILLIIYWISLFFISFFGGIYYTEMISMVTFTLAASITIRNLHTHEAKATEN